MTIYLNFPFFHCTFFIRYLSIDHLSIIFLKWTMTSRIIYCFIFISVFSYILMIFYTKRNMSAFLKDCDEEQFDCWLEKKQKLNENIARVCSKYRVEVEAKNTSRFLQHRKLVNCVNAKV